jgi:hypothetical protein|tara:strand:- start:71 stop:232 length:162 start_codon:yes stop_codon:yes gene_type:complete
MSNGAIPARTELGELCTISTKPSTGKRYLNSGLAKVARQRRPMLTSQGKANDG